MKFYSDILGLIGNTPLVKVNQLTRQHGIKAQVFAKMESLNPGYSVKDRIGISMIEAAEKDGRTKTRRHDHRSDFGQYGHRSRACGGGQRLQMRLCSDRQSFG